MIAGFEVGGRWKIIDNRDMITIWLAADGFYSQRVTGFKEANPISHAPIRVDFEEIILAAEGQKKLL